MQYQNIEYSTHAKQGIKKMIKTYKILILASNINTTYDRTQ